MDNCDSPPASPSFAYLTEPIDKNLECAICLQRLRDPRALPCQHVYCLDCLQSYGRKNLENRTQTIRCPICNQTVPFSSADKYPASYIHRNLLELKPKDYHILAKCTKCFEKTQLQVCNCCDYLLCTCCYNEHRQLIYDNIELVTQTCQYRLKCIQQTKNQLKITKQSSLSTIKQVETAYENLERKIADYKKHVLQRLYKYNNNLIDIFWSKLNLSSIDSIEKILKQADDLLKTKNDQQQKFDDVLTVYYSLMSTAEQLEHASTLINTYDLKKLLKSDIQLCGQGLPQMKIYIKKFDDNEKDEEEITLLPPVLLFDGSSSSTTVSSSSTSSSTSTTPIDINRQRRKKHEPKRYIVSQTEDDEEEYVENNQEYLPILKKLKIECEVLTRNMFDLLPASESTVIPNMLPSPTLSSNASVEFLESILNDDRLDEEEEESGDDDDVVYLETTTKNDTATIMDTEITDNFDLLFQPASY
ncbi:unnamed protein product [Didymodactylos carnosus]|uniref:RING-type domain-containing protein n=1 Tax=Didymodactylos carnosus TaxID=1234261 RepID=A0A813ZM95_9BILA|nr:unnamed protein product [Didymodactylos carnosus]CAF1019436.1 unnamed protein product [Didymodactylos carnosus]CAF3684642.1 unnamed protein product [Didymodactylos carnosus]CAF3788103.1 unnamed protein product [Didymodactylos carnosus]